MTARGAPERDQEVLAHLREEYAGVLDESRVVAHYDDYVGLDVADAQIATVQRRCPEARTLLDVGCGYGSFVLAARSSGLVAVGVDVAEYELGFARQRLAEVRPGDDPATVYQRASGTALPFGDAAFDVVTLWNVLEHVPDQAQVLAEAVRVLRPGGALFALAPNYATVREEPHYHVPWVPLPRRLALAYLRLLGRDPTFFRSSIHYTTNRGVVRALRSQGCQIDDLTSDKLDAAETIASPWKRRLVALLRALGLVAALRSALRRNVANPLKPAIAVVALRPLRTGADAR